MMEPCIICMYVSPMQAVRVSVHKKGAMPDAAADGTNAHVPR